MRLIISLTLSFSALLSGGFGIYAWHFEHRPHILEIYCFALDKSGASPGNLAIFIRTPENHTILIDGGKSGSIITSLTSVMPFYRRTIDTVISTNPDDSHVTGLVDVIDRYHIGQVIEASADLSATSSAYTTFEEEITAQKINHSFVSAGDLIDSGDLNLSVSVLFPAFASDFKYSKTNQPALAFLIHYGSVAVVIGDVTKKEQHYVSSEIASSSLLAGNISSTLLISPHVENTGEADEEFFNVLKPQNVIVLKKQVTVQKSKTLKTVKASETSTKSTKSIFDISTLSDLLISNLTLDGDREFTSDGRTFFEKQL